MARTLRDAKLDTRAARLRLKPRREPYWRSISGGMAVGYRKGIKGGTWVGKLYSAEFGRRYQALGKADDVTDADGVHALSFVQAQDVARKWFTELAQRQRGAIPNGPYSVTECVQAYLTWLEGHGKPGTSTRYRAETLILPKLGDFQCSKLNTDQLQRWLRDLAASPARIRTKKGSKQRLRKVADGDKEAIRRRRSSANRILTILKAALNRAWKGGRIPSDAAWRRVEPFQGVDAARIRYLSIDQATRLINASDPDFRQLAHAASVTGARYSELAALRASDFNPDSESIHIRTSKAGKERHIVLNKEGAALFKSLVSGRADDALMLPKADGSPWGQSHQKRPMEKACKRARIQPPASFHVMRHTWASHAVMAGAPLLVVARNLGHSDTRMVEKHYGHLAPSYIVDAIRAAAPKFGIKPDRKVVSINAKA